MADEETKTAETTTETAPEVTVAEVKTADAPVAEAPKTAAAVPDKPPTSEEKAAPSGKFAEVITKIESLSALELADLVKALEERFGVSAAAPMMMAGAMPAAGGIVAEVAEEKTHYTLYLAEAGSQKIAVIKALREIMPDLGLKEAKDLAEAAPKTIKENMPKAEAEEAKKKLEAAGAKAELK